MWHAFRLHLITLRTKNTTEIDDTVPIYKITQGPVLCFKQRQIRATNSTAAFLFLVFVENVMYSISTYPLFTGGR